ncbi:MAG: hypothetical protein L0J86_07105, partial [Corynebacterium sp.]|nr:hypothetical protein [Corynebacterium sp.]
MSAVQADQARIAASVAKLDASGQQATRLAPAALPWIITGIMTAADFVIGMVGGDGDGGGADGAVRLALNEDAYRSELAADGLPGLGLTVAGGRSAGDV